VKLGLYGLNTGQCADPETAVRVARAAEAAGFESLWTAEHIVLPDPQVPPSPVPPETELLDPAVALAFLAAHTNRVKLATGIVILPQRNPVVLAKEFASLDRVSKGRVILGVAAGYLESEFAAIGADFHSRGARTDEYIEAIRELWTNEAPRYDGKTVKFSGIQSRPLPTQRPHPPIVIGGMSDSALARAWRHGDGWYGFSLDPDATKQMLDRLRTARTNVTNSRPELEITITPPPASMTPEGIARYRDLGVHRLVPLGFGRSGDDVIAAVERYAELTIRADALEG